MTAQQDLKKPFHLIRWFSILSLISISLISVVSAAVFSRFITNNLLLRDATIAMQFINSIVRTENGIEYFKVQEVTDSNADIEEFFVHVAGMPDILRANVYAMDGTVIWSSNEELIGKRFDDNPDLEIAFTGRLHPEVEDLKEEAKEEHGELAQIEQKVIENYLPVWDHDNMSVVGVIEVYRSPHALFQAIELGRNLIWTGAVVAGLFLYITLFWIVWRAGRVIEQQQGKLIESETMAVIGEMASAVAHGLRNPLASIRSSAELMLEDELEDDRREALADIVSQSDRLEVWIRSFLTGSHISSDELEKLQINDVISDCVSAFVQQLKERKVQFVLRTQEDLPMVKANFAALRQVVNSIIANGIEAMPEGGELMVQSSTGKDGRYVVVTFRDTGQGVPKAQLEKIFQPFVTTKGSGMGVGLPLAKRIVERMGGILELASQEGKGATVMMQIPAAA